MVDEAMELFDAEFQENPEAYGLAMMDSAADEFDEEDAEFRLRLQQLLVLLQVIHSMGQMFHHFWRLRSEINLEYCKLWVKIEALDKRGGSAKGRPKA